MALPLFTTKLLCLELHFRVEQLEVIMPFYCLRLYSIFLIPTVLHLIPHQTFRALDLPISLPFTLPSFLQLFPVSEHSARIKLIFFMPLLISSCESLHGWPFERVVHIPFIKSYSSFWTWLEPKSDYLSWLLFLTFKYFTSSQLLLDYKVSSSLLSSSPETRLCAWLCYKHFINVQLLNSHNNCLLGTIIKSHLQMRKRRTWEPQ